MIYLIDPNIVGSACTAYVKKCSPRYLPLYGTPV